MSLRIREAALELGVKLLFLASAGMPGESLTVFLNTQPGRLISRYLIRCRSILSKLRTT